MNDLQRDGTLYACDVCILSAARVSLDLLKLKSTLRNKNHPINPHFEEDCLVRDSARR